MKLRKLDINRLDQIAEGVAIKGTCLLLPGFLAARPESDELPKLIQQNLPNTIICKACDAYLERLLNERGVAVVTPGDPVDAIPDSAEVELDLAGGTITEASSGRKFALVPLEPDHLKFVRAHG